MARPPKYGFEKLEPGQELLVPFADDVDRPRFVDRIRNAVRSWNRRGYRMSANHKSNGVRVKLLEKPKR